MRVPLSEMYTVVSYLLKQKWAGRERFPMVLMLEPLYRCNLACAGCGKIQYPSNVLKSQLSVWVVNEILDQAPGSEHIRSDERLEWHLYLKGLEDTGSFYKDLENN